MQTPATPYLSLVMSRGKRFESARRLSRFGLNKPNSGVRGRAEWWARNFLHHSYITEGMGRVGFVSARYLDCRRLSTSWTLWTLTPGETLRCSFTCSGISDCPRGCATRMAPTTSRLTPHHRNQDILRRLHQALPRSPGKTACTSELPSPRPRTRCFH